MRYVWILIAGCAGEAGRDGVAGPPGATGPAGAPGAAGGGYRWVDAVGTPVTRGGEALYFDEGGIAWSIDLERATLLPVSSTLRYPYFESSDCSGDPWALDVALPRFAMSGDAVGEPDRFFVRADGAASLNVTLASAEDPLAGCVPLTVTGDAVPMASLTEVSLPVVSWVAPLHPEPL